MIELTAAKGLGDAIYLRALVLHLIKRGEPVTVFTGWPEVFSDLPVTLKAQRTGEEDIRHCAYCLHCRLPEITAAGMFSQACRQAGIFDQVELRIDWVVRNQALVDRIRRAAAGRQILVYQPPKIAKGPEQELLQPGRKAFREYVAAQRGYRVKVGDPDAVGDCIDMPCELDLVGKTTVSDAFDVATIADAVFSEPCYLTTLAQALDKLAVCMFTRRAQAARQARVRNLTPERFFHKPGIATAIYDE